MSLSLTEFAQLAQTTIRSLQMYTASHPRSQASSQAMLDKLNDHFQEGPTVKISASNGILFLDGQPGDARNLHIHNLCKTLTERYIAGFQLDKGLVLEELMGLMEVLLLKPAKIDELGGPDAIVSSKNMPHVRLTQTKFLEMEEDQEAVLVTPEEASEAGDKRRLQNLWQEKLRECVEAALAETDGTVWEPSFLGGLPPANLAEAGTLASELKWEANSPPPVHWEAVQLALESLSAAEQLSVITGRASLPETPSSLKKVMEGFFPDILAKAAAKLDNECIEWKGLKEAVYLAITAKGDVTELYKAFGTLWMKSGKDTSQVAEIKECLQWDYRPIQEQLASIEQPRVLQVLVECQRIKLMKHIVEKMPSDSFHNFIKKMAAASTHGDTDSRQNAVKTLEFFSSSISKTPIKNEQETILIQSLIEIFEKDPEPGVLAICMSAIRNIICMYAERSDQSKALDILIELESRIRQGSPSFSSQTKALSELKASICSKGNIEPVIQQYFQKGSEYFEKTALPWLKALGLPAVEILMEMLSEESDRRRRGQIMDAIRSFGNEVLPKLVQSLDSDKWYLVRNTLILIAEMADSSCFDPVVKCLQHVDTRVKRAAARTLWRGFGKLAAEPFLRAISSAEPEIFEEILFGLGQIPAPDAVPMALDYAVDAENPDRLRVLALNILVSNPSEEAVPILSEIAKRKGLMKTTVEPTIVRVAAAKAMAAAGKQGAEKFMEIFNSEPRGPDRDELSKILGP
ncbi:MAG: HEAT repeat domain-containing protein [Holophagaceae bacterium]|nr:HEAT repeat domain-containing protein [Holophagaceae bacterium]